MSEVTYTSNGGSLNLKTLEETINLIYRLDPIAAYMRDAGFDPMEGCIMVVPKKIWEDEGFPERSFVKKSDFVQQIIMFRQPLFDKFNFEYEEPKPEPENPELVEGAG